MSHSATQTFQVPCVLLTVLCELEVPGLNTPLCPSCFHILRPEKKENEVCPYSDVHEHSQELYSAQCRALSKSMSNLIAKLVFLLCLFPSLVTLSPLAFPAVPACSGCSSSCSNHAGPRGVHIRGRPAF